MSKALGAMAEGSNQHFVPQFYFRYFSKDGRSINVILRKDGKAIRSASIKGQASQQYFYGDSYAEKQLAAVDTLHSQALNEVRSAARFNDCSVDAQLCCYQNVMLQRTRTVAGRLSGQPMADRIMQLQLEVLINNDNNLTDDQRHKLLETIPEMGANEKQVHALHLAEAVRIADTLSDLVPIYLENKTNRPYIFSDAPVVFINLICRNIINRGVLGADSQGLMVFYPLSPTRMLMMLDGDAYGIKGRCHSAKAVRDLRDVAAINKLQLHSAVNSIYFSSESHARYVQELWRQEKGRLSKHAGIVTEAPGFDQIGESIGDVIHSYQPQLSFMPKLSFLRYQAISEEQYAHPRRRSFRA
ncbi:DUF4238 domain-containing protein [Salinisphaera sp. SPP-AMP-43]|uniref:DUF4238 domain-containing protein n=1 Tax=Salinisphaera sp. SPP-AMP-43 TaxID=3121288 RepID=UPI003C6E66D3